MNTEAAISKVRKLFALARDDAATEGEAANAMAAASRIMLEHNLSEADIGTATSEGPVWGDWSSAEFKPWAVWVAHAVGKLYSCKFVMVHKHGMYQFVGRKANTEACLETMRFLCEQIEELYKLELKRHGGRLDKRLRAELRQTFKEACAARVFRRASEIMAANGGVIPDHKALVVVETMEEEAQALIDAARVKSKEVSLRRFGIGTGAGMAAGDQVRIRGEVK